MYSRLRLGGALWKDDPNRPFFPHQILLHNPPFMSASVASALDRDVTFTVDKQPHAFKANERFVTALCAAMEENLRHAPWAATVVAEMWGAPTPLGSWARPPSARQTSLGVEPNDEFPLGDAHMQYLLHGDWQVDRSMKRNPKFRSLYLLNQIRLRGFVQALDRCVRHLADPEVNPYRHGIPGFDEMRRVNRSRLEFRDLCIYPSNEHATSNLFSFFIVALNNNKLTRRDSQPLDFTSPPPFVDFITHLTNDNVDQHGPRVGKLLSKDYTGSYIRVFDPNNMATWATLLGSTDSHPDDFDGFPILHDNYVGPGGVWALLAPGTPASAARHAVITFPVKVVAWVYGYSYFAAQALALYGAFPTKQEPIPTTLIRILNDYIRRNADSLHFCHDGDGRLILSTSLQCWYQLFFPNSTRVPPGHFASAFTALLLQATLTHLARQVWQPGASSSASSQRQRTLYPHAFRIPASTQACLHADKLSEGGYVHLGAQAEPISVERREVEMGIAQFEDLVHRRIMITPAMSASAGPDSGRYDPFFAAYGEALYSPERARAGPTAALLAALSPGASEGEASGSSITSSDSDGSEGSAAGRALARHAGGIAARLGGRASADPGYGHQGRSLSFARSYEAVRRVVSRDSAAPIPIPIPLAARLVEEAYPSRSPGGTSHSIDGSRSCSSLPPMLHAALGTPEPARGRLEESMGPHGRGPRRHAGPGASGAASRAPRSALLCPGAPARPLTGLCTWELELQLWAVPASPSLEPAPTHGPVLLAALHSCPAVGPANHGVHVIWTGIGRRVEASAPDAGAPQAPLRRLASGLGHTTLVLPAPTSRLFSSSLNLPPAAVTSGDGGGGAGAGGGPGREAPLTTLSTAQFAISNDSSTKPSSAVGTLMFSIASAKSNTSDAAAACPYVVDLQSTPLAKIINPAVNLFGLHPLA
eukprot:tig00021720_g23176.t1